MAKSKTAYLCDDCGWQTVKWVGRCGSCKAWGTMVQFSPGASAGTVNVSGITAAIAAQPIGQVDAQQAHTYPTGVGEFDRVLGGGLVAGGVVLVAGEPGVGKSTMLLAVAAHAAAHGPVLYVSGEESSAQVRLRAERIGALAAELFVVSDTDVLSVLSHIEKVNPRVVIVDSVQTLVSPEVDGVAGGVAQIRQVANAIIAVAKSRGIPAILVGHVTKEGTIAGPRLLEHVVDVVVTFAGERHSRLRLVRAVKNRYGPTDEVGCFDLGDSGITELPDPSGLFLGRREGPPAAGTCVVPTLEGRRPLLAEVQALLAQASSGSARRTTAGVDHSRLAMILAILERHTGLNTSKMDCYVSTVGGAKVGEPAADVAIALAVASSFTDQALPAKMVAFGELSLAGDIRPVSGMKQRLSEAGRLGFTAAIVPNAAVDDVQPPQGMRVVPVTNIAQALQAALGTHRARSKVAES